MSMTSEHGIFKVVGIVIMPSAEIEPGMRELVHKKRGRARNVLVVAVNHLWPADRMPRVRRNGCRSRTDRKQIQHHGFAVGIPAQVAESVLGLPIEREGLTSVERPRPVDAVI